MQCVTKYFSLHNELLFVGKGLNGHLNKHAGTWLKEVRNIEVVPCDTPAEALDLRNELITDLQPTYNIYHNEGEMRENG